VIIQSVALRAPSLCITNDDIIRKIHEHNTDVTRDHVAQYCNKVRRLLRAIGAETRYIRDREGGERGFNLLIDAARASIKDAGMDVREIDLIIYCGVGRGFLEPANAIFVAKVT
jgi:3-oxoacyl-[acyl-carrier-protein] synthase III